MSSGPGFSTGPKFRSVPSGRGSAVYHGPKLKVGQSTRLRSYKGPSSKLHTFKSTGKVQAFKSGKAKFAKTPGGKLGTLQKGQAFPQKHAVVYRPWHRKRYYGRRFAGVIIGTIFAASVYYAYSAPPDPELCWYWANPEGTRGYWDFCDAPPPDWY